MTNAHRVTIRKICLCCHRGFKPDPRVGVRQQYCSESACQKRRQRKNEYAWRKKNPECVSAQRNKWQNNHAGYLIGWRIKHPAAMRRNRELTRKRLRRKRRQAMFDKSKEWRSQVARDKGVMYMNCKRRWILVRLKRASRLSLAWSGQYPCEQVKKDAVRLPRGRLYKLTERQ